MTLQTLKESCRQKLDELGEEFKNEIYDIYAFAEDEVNAGESEDNEVELALDALDDLKATEPDETKPDETEADKYNQSRWNGL